MSTKWKHWALVLVLCLGCVGLYATLDEPVESLSTVSAAQAITPTPAGVAVLDEAQATNDLEAQVISVYGDAAPSVVNVTSRYVVIDFFRRYTTEQEGTGSGFIWDDAGHIVTNYHVIENADEVVVSFANGDTYDAKVIGVDAANDLAVLQVDASQGLPAPLALADSSQLRVGQFVIAIGNPYGLANTMTLGVISALERVIESPEENGFIGEAIQTDAAINPGNSGGALVDVNGNLLGINTAIYSRSGGSLGIGFAIPVSTAKMVLSSITTTGQVTRGWIGVEPSELSPEMAETFGVKATSGVLITGVLQNAPGAQAGLRPGDVITQVAGKPVVSVSGLLSAVAALTPGETAGLRVQRGDQEVALEVTPGVRPKQRRAPVQR